MQEIKATYIGYTMCYTENNAYHFPESLTALETDTCIIQLAVSHRQNNLYLLLTIR